MVANTQDEIRTTRVSMAAADLIIGCDPIVSASKETTLRMRAGRTHVALNSNSTPTAAFVKNGNWQNPAEQCVAEIATQVGASGVGAFDADALAKQLMGDRRDDKDADDGGGQHTFLRLFDVRRSHRFLRDVLVGRPIEYLDENHTREQCVERDGGIDAANH